MELRDAIEKRHTVRDFKNQEISTDIIQYAIENAFKAPSYNHLREWDFIIVRGVEAKRSIIESENLDKEINPDDLENLFKKEESVKKEMYLDAIPKQKRMILTAPVTAIIVFKPKTTVEKAKTVYDLNCLASAWCCIENFLLSLAEHDLFGVTYIPQNCEKIRERLGIPQGLEIAAIIPFGYKSEDAKKLKQKPINVTDRIHYEKY
jgi:nitroreductase